MDEVFHPIPRFPRYLIGNRGSVRSNVRKGRFLRWWLSSRGYPMVTLMANGRPAKFFVHRLVALAFIPNPLGRPSVNHRNGIKHDCDVSNLEWATLTENNGHARAAGLNKAFGQTHYRTRLDDQDIRRIRELAALGVFHRDIAARFGVGRKAITKIVNGQRWRHL
jgi:hypothetical protein